MPFAKRTVTFGSFGADFDSMNLAVAGLNNTNFPNPYTTVCLELHNEAVFDERVTVSGIGSNIQGLLITVADDDWHKGDIDTGVVFRPSTTGSSVFVVNDNLRDGIRVERLRIDGNLNNTGNFNGILQIGTGVDSGDPSKTRLDKMIVTGGDGINAGRGVWGCKMDGRPATLTNSLFYSVKSNGEASASAAQMVGGDDKIIIMHCTMDEFDWVNGTGSNYGTSSSSASTTAQIIGNIHTNMSNTVADIETGPGVYESATSDTSGTTQNIIRADEFVNPAIFNYLLKAGADSEGIVSDMSCHVFPELLRDITGQIRLPGVADAGCYNNLSGYEAEGGGGDTFVIVCDED